MALTRNVRAFQNGESLEDQNCLVGKLFAHRTLEHLVRYLNAPLNRGALSGKIVTPRVDESKVQELRLSNVVCLHDQHHGDKRWNILSVNSRTPKQQTTKNFGELNL